MQSVLIITEDVVKIQLLAGVFGRLYAWFYLGWYRFRLQLIILALSRKYKISLVVSDCLEIKSRPQFLYSTELGKLDYAANRRLYWRVTKKICSSELVQTRLMTYLTYNYFVYADLYQKIISAAKPDKIIVVGSSYHELLAAFIARQAGLAVQKISFASLSGLNAWLNRFFLHREYLFKLWKFFLHTGQLEPDKQQLKQATLLSLDFYRHLKILTPLYLQLDEVKANPWFITDMPHPKAFLRHLNIGAARCVSLASFISKKIFLQQLILTEKTVSRELKRQSRQLKPAPDNLADFLGSLSLKPAGPIILHGQALAQVYLRAGTKLFAFKPRGVVVVSDSRFIELSLALLAKKFQVPSVMASPNAFLDLAQINPYQSTDKIAVIGPFIRQQLINQGLAPAKISISGDPSLENSQLPSASINRQKVFQQLKLDPQQKIILLISFRPNWLIPAAEKARFIKMSVAAAKTQPGSVLIIKPHPTENQAALMAELKQWGITNVIVTDNHQFSLFTLLQAASVVLQTWSMTIFEAVMLDRPVICINPLNKNYTFFLPVIKPGAGIEVKTQVDLNHWLKIFLTRPQKLPQHLQVAKAALAEFIQPPDGQATQRVLRLFRWFPPRRKD